MILVEKIKEIILIFIVIFLPFNLVIGRIFPSLVSFPLYIIDVLILLLGFFLFFAWKKNKILFTPQEKIIVIFLFFFFCLGFITIFLNMPEIIQFVEEKDRYIVYGMLKQIISDTPTQSINKTIQIGLSLFLFFSISISALRKELLLKIACIPLAFILLINLYLVVNQQDVVLDGGREGVTIHPYGIKEIGRAYFPFVNSLLLSVYLSLFFFVALFFLMNNNKDDKRTNRQKIFFGTLLFFLILVLGFTKGRAALLTVFSIFLFLNVFLFIRKLVSPFPKLFFCFVGLFLFLTVLSSFFTISVFDNIFERYQSQKSNAEVQADMNNINTQYNNQEMTTPDVYQQINFSFFQAPVLREVDANTVQKGRYTLHWPTALVLFQSEPIFGVGTGLFYYSVLVSHREILCGVEEHGLWTLCPDKMELTDISSTAHSIYLQVLAENGILGFILFFVLVGFILIFGYKKVRQSHKNDFCSVFIFAAVLAFFLQGFFISYFEFREITYLLWMFVGLLFKKEERIKK